GSDRTSRHWSTDKAANSEDRSQPQNTITINIDNTAPAIAGARTPAANSSGWNNSPVTVTFSCADAESGIASCTPASTVLSGEGAGQSVNGTATDNAGNSSLAAVTDVNIDLTPPVITPTYPAANTNGWYNG